MQNTLAQGYEHLRRSILETAGDTQVDLRAEVEARAASLSGREGAADPQAGPLGIYLDKLAQQAYRLVDADVERLLEAGYSQDAIFELTLAAALGAAAGRFECATDALAELS